MTLLFNILEDRSLLSYFLQYYHALGVTKFVCGLHKGHSNPQSAEIAQKLRSFPHVLYCSYCEEFSAQRDADAQNKMRLELLRPDDWYVIADLDEFHHNPAFSSFARMKAEAEAEGAEYVGSSFIDRIACEGKIFAIDRLRSLDEQFPFSALLTTVILRGCADKVVMAKGSVGISAGHHSAAGRRASFLCQTHHFKWHGKNLLEQLEQRSWTYAKQGVPYWNEPLNFVEYCFRSQNKIDSSDPSLQVSLAQKIGI